MNRFHAAHCLAGTILAVAARAPAQDGCQPSWSALGGGANWQVRTLGAVDEDGPGPKGMALFAGGGFEEFAGTSAMYIGRWDGWNSSRVGTDLWSVDGGAPWDMCGFGEPRGLVPFGLYVGGDMLDSYDGVELRGLGLWQGAPWDDVDGGLTSDMHVFGFATCIFDEDGGGPLPPYLYVGGKFEYAGGVPAKSLARWDGQSWSAVGAGLGDDFPVNLSVNALTVFDDGRGPALYVGGSFYYAGGQKAYNIARWDGRNWEPLGGVGKGLNGSVESFAVYDEDGPGPGRASLFMGGQFSGYIGGPQHQLLGVARWDGVQWSDVGKWAGGGVVPSMVLWQGPDDDRENLYIGGSFSYLPDGTLANHVARWNGSLWRDVGGGVDGGVDALVILDEDGGGPNRGGLYVGGLFSQAGNISARCIARWGCPLGPRCDADLDRDGQLSFFDFLNFVNLFNADDPQADFDADGELTLFDFLAFTNAFNAGC